MAMITRPKTRATPTAPSSPPYSALATIAPAPAKTSANAARLSAAARRARSGRGTIASVWSKVGQQRLNTLRDLVAYLAHGCQVLAGRVLELPILVALARIDRAGVAAAHRDHRVGGPDDVVRERLRELLRQIHANLGHGLDNRRVDPVGGLRAGRADEHSALRELIQQSGRHLAASRVVNADEQDLRDLPRHASLKDIPLTYVSSIDICK